MPARLFRVILPAVDVDEAARFYAAILGLPGERVSGARHYFECGGTILACVGMEAEQPAFRPNIEHVYFAVDDIEETYARAASAGCSWLGESIVARAWGERSFYARDPSGNPICFVQSGTEFTGGRFVP